MERVVVFPVGRTHSYTFVSFRMWSVLRCFRLIANIVYLPCWELSLEKLAKKSGLARGRRHGLPADVLRKLISLISKRNRNPTTFGLRSLASAMSAVLKLNKPMAHETARRLSLSLQLSAKV
jgi:hypothetical protein